MSTPWTQFGESLGWPGDYSGDGDVLRTTSTAPMIRTTDELTRKLFSAGGSILVGPHSSEFIVASNNRLRFSVTQDANDPTQYRIASSNTGIYLLGAGALVLLIAVLK